MSLLNYSLMLLITSMSDCAVIHSFCHSVCVCGISIAYTTSCILDGQLGFLLAIIYYITYNIEYIL